MPSSESRGIALASPRLIPNLHVRSALPSSVTVGHTMQPSALDDWSLALAITGPADPERPKRSKDIPVNESAVNTVVPDAVLSLNMGRTTDAIEVLPESESSSAGPDSFSCHPVFTGNTGAGTTAVVLAESESAADGRVSLRHPIAGTTTRQANKRGARYGTMHVICSPSRGNVESRAYVRLRIPTLLAFPIFPQTLQGKE